MNIEKDIEDLEKKISINAKKLDKLTEKIETNWNKINTNTENIQKNTSALEILHEIKENNSISNKTMRLAFVIISILLVLSVLFNFYLLISR